MSPLLSCLSEKKDALINAVLTGRDFLFKKEISLQEGAQPVEVYYHQSMEFTPKLQEKNWKVLPYLSSFDVSKEDSAVKAKEFSYSEERELFDWTVFTEISQKYILYKLFEKKLGLNIDKNCSLVVNLKKGQEKYLY